MFLPSKHSQRASQAALMLVAALSLCTPARAAAKAQLLALRDASHPGVCDLKPGDPAYPGIERFELAGPPKMMLSIVPCRATALEILDVAFIQDGGQNAGQNGAPARPLYFATPGFDLGDGNHWNKARMAGIGVTATISAPVVDKHAGIIHTSSRIPPGLGQGDLSFTYKIEGGSAALTRFAVALDGKRPIVIWQAPRAQ